MNATPDTQEAIRLLETAGAEPELARAIATVAATTPRPTARSAISTALGTAIPTIVVPLLIAAVGWFIVGELRQMRTEMLQLRSEMTDQGERLTRVETLLEVRLPPAQ